MRSEGCVMASVCVECGVWIVAVVGGGAGGCRFTRNELVFFLGVGIRV